ncbi:MAG: hypothetical protein ABJZ70_05025 [Cyclobacteriaceae bacterium]
MGHYAKSTPATFHLKAAQIILRYQILRFIAAWFRGSAKSVVFNIFIPLWLKIQHSKEYHTFVLVGKSNDAADILISDLQAEFENNQKYIYDFGEQKNNGSWEEGKFTTRDGTSFFALGRGQSPRGLRKQAFRPDLIVIDDIDDDELVENEARVDKVIDWLNKALILAMDKGRGRVLFANNIIHEKSVVAKMAEKYRQLKKQQKQSDKDLSYHYEVMVVNIRGKDGKSSWPENMSEAEIDELEHELGYAYAQTELYNNPVTVGKIFKKEWIQFKVLPALNKYKHLLAYFDPGYKNTSTSDSMALILLGLYAHEYHVIKVFCDKVSRNGAVLWHYDLQQYLDARGAAAEFYMEEKFMLDILYEDFDAAAEEQGYHISVSGDTRNKPDKDLRIKSLQGIFERGKVFFNAREEANHHMANLVGQFTSFEPPKKTLKDGPDAFEGAHFLLRHKVTGSPDAMSYGKPRSKTISKF